MCNRKVWEPRADARGIRYSTDIRTVIPVQDVAQVSTQEVAKGLCQSELIMCLLIVPYHCHVLPMSISGMLDCPIMTRFAV